MDVDAAVEGVLVAVARQVQELVLGERAVRPLREHFQRVELHAGDEDLQMEVSPCVGDYLGRWKWVISKTAYPIQVLLKPGARVFVEDLNDMIDSDPDS